MQFYNNTALVIGGGINVILLLFDGNKATPNVITAGIGSEIYPSTSTMLIDDSIARCASICLVSLKSVQVETY